MVFGLSVLRPWREVSQFAVVAVVSHPHLRADKQDLSVVDDNAAVVDDILVRHGPRLIHASISEEEIGDKLKLRTNIPISQRMPAVSLLARSFASTSQECRTVSPLGPRGINTTDHK